MRIDEDLKYVLKMTFMMVTPVIMFTSFIVGVCNGSNDNCNYNSIGSRINIGYVIGCELTKPRFKSEADKKKELEQQKKFEKWLYE